MTASMRDAGVFTVASRGGGQGGAIFFDRAVADPGGGVTGTDPLPPWNVDDVTRAMSKGCVLVNVQAWGVFFNLSEGGWRHADNV